MFALGFFTNLLPVILFVSFSMVCVDSYAETQYEIQEKAFSNVEHNESLCFYKIEKRKFSEKVKKRIKEGEYRQYPLVIDFRKYLSTYTKQNPFRAPPQYSL